MNRRRLDCPQRRKPGPLATKIRKTLSHGLDPYSGGMGFVEAISANADEEDVTIMDMSPAQIQRIMAEATRTVDEELSDVPIEVDGELPVGLDGVLFRNGPGRFERGGRRYGHPFDGDGHIVRLDIGPHGLRYRNRFVRTAEYRAEEQAGRMRYRGLGTNLPGGVLGNVLRFHTKNPANTNIIWHGGRLLALWEGGPPHRLDPYTLETLGKEDFAGQLRNHFSAPGRWLTPLMPFSAHPSVDAVSGELVNFGILFGPPDRLMIYRVDCDGRMSPPQAYELPRFSFVHDIAVTPRWFCVLLPYAEFDLPRVFLGRATVLGSLKLATERPMQALLIPREGGEPRLIETVSGFVFHIAQAFDREDGNLVLDAIRYGRFPAVDDMADLFAEPNRDFVPHLERLELDPDRRRCQHQQWGMRAAELPTAVPGALGAEHRIIYTVGAPPERELPYLTSIQRLDTATGEMRFYDLGEDLPSEPIPVPGPGGDEGWLLSLVYRAGEDRSDLLVLRAADLEVVAVAALPHAVPFGFHGTWVPRSSLAGDGASENGAPDDRATVQAK